MILLALVVTLILLAFVLSLVVVVFSLAESVLMQRIGSHVGIEWNPLRNARFTA